MASRETSGSSGKEGTGRGKAVDYKQRRLTMEVRGTDSMKKVIFKLEDEMEDRIEKRGARGEGEYSIGEEIKLMREERRAFIENKREERRSVMESLNVKERFWEERIRGIDEKMIERENRVKEWIEKAREGKFREREEEAHTARSRL
ncbi:hypothetical protein ALC57_18743 [Trachymyrmex cornetzi]|uniref:Uncharacterized protein n=1 Tax=Trachymyrmex cornetzi TaxID=471704 RepID=A0A151IR90_9HYME|nr:hypothetical protein ALC57_18743 [Trachymyrmex cornetzi]